MPPPLPLPQTPADTAALYGNEVEVGVAMRNSNVEPGQLFVTTKLWGTDQKKAHTIKRAYTSSTEKLNVGARPPRLGPVM